MLSFEYQDAYVLYRRPYRETSSLVDLWVQDTGLIRAVIKGLHGPGQTASQRNAWLQPFQLLAVEIYGQAELKTIYKFEPRDSRVVAYHGLWSQSVLLAGHYLNELVLKALRKFEPEPALFNSYTAVLTEFKNLNRAFSNLMHSTQRDQTLVQTNPKRDLAKLLRVFEQELLLSIGFGIDWGFDRAQAQIQSQLYYDFMAGQGFQINESGELPGRLIVAAGQGQWAEAGALSTARCLLRQQFEWCFDGPLRVPSLQGNA